MRCRLATSVRMALLVMVAVSGRGQVANSRLEGVIHDPSGARIPAANVVAVDNRTGLETSVIGDPQGFFVFLSLPPGEYTVTVEAPGFRRSVLRGEVLNAAAIVVENIRLELGPVTESVTVAARNTGIQLSNSQVDRVVALRDLEVLPQLERNPITLAIFQPGVQIRGGNIGLSRINGTRQGSNSIKVDGIIATEPINPALSFSANVTTPDSVQEFRIVTHGGQAEYGSYAGAQVDMITRSGANRWSGNAYDYLRNTALNANDFFSNSSGGERPKFIQNVFGGSLGGPLIHNRTFLFGTFQGIRARQEVIRNRNVLTPSARNGLFRWTQPGSAGIQEFDILRNDPRGKGVDPGMAALIRLLPDPNNFDIGDGLNTGGYRFNNASNSAQDQFTIRADHNLSQSVRLFFRLSWLRPDYIDSLNGADAPFPGHDGCARRRGGPGSTGCAKAGRAGHHRRRHPRARPPHPRCGAMPGGIFPATMAEDEAHALIAEGPVHDRARPRAER